MAKLALGIVTLLLFSLNASAMTSEYFDTGSYPMVVEFGFEYLHPTFGTIDQVVVRNPQTSNEVAPVTGGVNQTYPDVFAQTIRASALLNAEKKLKINFQSFLPLNALTQMDTGNVYLPEYVLYRAENQRPRVSVMGEMNLSDSFRLGLGMDLGFGVKSEATVVLQSGAGKYSNQRIAATVKPRIIPLAVLEYDGYRLSVKGENKVNFELSAAASANVFPPLSASFDVTYGTTSALFYDPWTFDLSHRYGLSGIGMESWTLGLGASYQLWTGYQARAAVIRDISSTFSNGLTPSFKTRNLLVPRITIEKRFGNQRWEWGYEFKDSIFKETPSANGNYLDPPRHTVSVNANFPFYTTWEIGVGLQVARLTEQTVVKTDATEIGAPGYRASGWLYGGKVNLTIPFEDTRQR